MIRQSRTAPIPPERQASRGWRAYLNGEALSEVRHLVLEHDQFGTLSYGLTSNGHDGWTFRAEHGGGAVVLPYCRDAGRLFVGVVQQYRGNQGGHVSNAPRGFLERGESATAGALRELIEETRLGPAGLDLVSLPGEPANPDSAFFETWAPNEGVKFFALEVPRPWLRETSDGLVFHPSALDRSASSRKTQSLERISGARFIAWDAAVLLQDMFTVAAVGRLLAYLAGEQQVSVTC